MKNVTPRKMATPEIMLMKCSISIAIGVSVAGRYTYYKFITFQ